MEAADKDAATVGTATDVASINSKGKKRKTVKDAVIPQFNPTAAVYRPQPNPFDLTPHNTVNASASTFGGINAGPHQVAAPSFAMYPTVSSSAVGLPPMS